MPDDLADLARRREFDECRGPCRAVPAALDRNCARPISSSPISNAVCTGRRRDAGIPSSMRVFRRSRDRRRGVADRRDRSSRDRQQRQLRQRGDPRLDRRTRPARDRPYRRRRGFRSGLGAGCCRARRDAGRVRAAQLGLLADQPRGDRNRRRHRGVARPHGLSGSGAQDPARDPADEPARRAPDRRDLGRPRLSQEP